MKNINPILPVAMLLVLILSCANPDKGKDGFNPGSNATISEKEAAASSVDTAALNSVRWELTELASKPVAEYPAQNKKPYITFNQETRMLSGTGGCNSISGLYTLGAPNLMSIKNLITTKMACPDLTVEDAFAGALEKTTNYAIDGSVLTLRDSAGNVVAKFMAGH